MEGIETIKTLDNLKLLEQLQDNSFAFNLEKTGDYIKNFPEFLNCEKETEDCCKNINEILKNKFENNGIDFNEIFKNIKNPIGVI